MISRRTLKQPLRTLCDNAGAEGSVLVEAVKKEKKKTPAGPGQGGGGGFDGRDY